MILFYFLLFLLVIARLRFSRQGFYADYLSFDTTNAIKGIFIALVFIKHVTPYILNSGYVFDDSFFSRAFLFIDAQVGQWIVAMFLFYSGYGIMESIRKKGIAYIRSIPRKRILTTLINFDIAVVLFAIVSLFVPSEYTIKQYLLSFTGWEAVGNSNWYIFIIMLCYLLAYLCFRVLIGKREYYFRRTIICSFLLGISVLVLSFVKPFWWYDTMLCFGVGILYSVCRNRIEVILKKYYWFILPVLIILLTLLGKSPYYLRGLVHNTYCIVFCLLIVLLTMKIKVNNAALIWAGKNLFPLYIYQRVPMIILSSICGGAFVASYPVLYTFACLLITLLFAHFYKYWAVKL